MMVLGDTVDSALHDTLRLVRFVLHAPGAARVAIAGDFNGWSRTATPLADSAGSGVWSVVVALDRESRRYAFVVDDTQWVHAERMDGAESASHPLRATPVGGDST
jgi:1,4-alpha-glucan branching enzyme